MAQEIDEPLMQDAICVVRSLLNACREMMMTEEQGSLLENGAQDVEVECLCLATLCNLPKLSQSGDMVELRRVAGLLCKQIAASSAVSLEDMLSRPAHVALQLVVQHVEEEGVMR